MKLRNLLPALWNRLPLPYAALAVRVETGARRSGEPLPLNKICDARDWADPQWRAVAAELGFDLDPGRLRRKDWEFAQAVYGLRRLGCLAPEAEALGIGSGHEPILFFLARRLARVVATDIYAGDFGAHEADARMLTQPDLFAPHAYPAERLEVRRMDARSIDYASESFDVVFSFSSIEHFGSRPAQRRCLAEIGRVLRPGGIAIVTTEIILNRWGWHGEYFRPATLLGRLLPESGLHLAGGGFDFSTGEETLAAVVRIPEERERLPHLVLKRWNTLFTSCALFLEKPVTDCKPREGLAKRGAEVSLALPPLLAAETVVTAGPPTVLRPGTEFTIACRVRNRGAITWAPAAADGVGQVRLGAHLRGEDGALLQLDYGRGELPRAVPVGASVDVSIRLHAPSAAGAYLVELDMVREGVAWFSDREVQCAVMLPVRVG